MTPLRTHQYKRFRIEWICLALVIGLAGAFLVWSLARDLSAIRALEGERLLGQARVVDENLIRQLQGADKALKRVRDELGHRDPATEGAAATVLLTSLTEAMPGVSNMILQDRNGVIVASSRFDFINRTFAERAYFTRPRDGASPDVLYVSPPFRSVLGTFIVIVGHVVTNERGEFAGVVSASLDPEYFDVVIRSVLYAPDMHTTLVASDGKVFLDAPSGLGIVDLDEAGRTTPFSAFRRNAATSTLTTGALFPSGEMRMIAMRRVDHAALQMDQPMVIVVSRDIDAIERPWRSKVVDLGAVFVALSFALGLAVFFDHRRRERAERIATTVAEDRAVAAAALRDSEDQLREMADSIPALVARLDREQRFLFGNRAFRDWLGLEPVDLIGRTVREVYGEASYFRFAHHLEHALAGDEVVYERDMEIRNGTRRVAVTLTPQRGDDGAVKGLYALVVDISARFEADLLRMRSEERLSLALEGSGQALFDWDIANDRMYQSANAAVMRGLPAEATITSGEAVRSAVHPDDLAGVMEQIAAVMRGAEPLFRAEFRLARNKGDWVWVRAQGRVVEHDADGRARRVAGTYADINVEKAAEGQLRRLAENDDLTGLPNRALFNERLDQALTRVTSDRPLALLFLDIDHFKAVNDNHGHEAGDEVLKACAARMLAVVRKSDTVARLAGDEFTIILEAMHAPQDAMTVAGKLIERLRTPIVLGTRTLMVTASIGIALCEPGERDPAALLRRADAALYEAKRRGRDGFALDDAASAS